MPTLNIQPVTGPEAVLYKRYDGATRCQPVYLYLDLENGRAWIDYDPETNAGAHIGVHMLERLAHGVIQRWDVPLMIADTANKLLQHAAPLLQSLLDTAVVLWNGTDKVGRLSVRGEELAHDVESLIRIYGNDIGEAHAADWVLPEDLVELRSAADLDEVCRRLEEAAWTSDDGHIMLVGLRAYLHKAYTETA